MDLENRVALVTGATGALGTAVSLDLLLSGARVSATYRSPNEMEELERRAGKHQDNLFGIKVDLTRSDEVERAVAQVLERWGRLDFLITVAGGFAAGNPGKPTSGRGTTCST